MGTGAQRQALEAMFTQSLAVMKNVGTKNSTKRMALACGKITLGQAFQAVIDKKVEKADPQSIAHLAAVQAVKKTPDMVMLCHPLVIDQVLVHTEIDTEEKAMLVYVLVSAEGKTGVEMEAINATQAALANVYDVCKMYEKGMMISGVTLLLKTGGKSATYVSEHASDEIKNIFCLPPVLDGVKVASIHCSDRASRGVYEAEPQDVLLKQLPKDGADVVFHSVVPDEATDLTNAIKQAIQKGAEIIITSGGTGLSPRDIAPETLQSLPGARAVLGIGEKFRQLGYAETPSSCLSRSGAIQYDNTLILYTAGRTDAVMRSYNGVKDVLKTAVLQIKGKKS